MARKVTIASMIYTDGKETVYGIYKATLREPTKREPYVDIHKAEQIASIKTDACCDRGGMGFEEWYLHLAEQYATEDYPAFAF